MPTHSTRRSSKSFPHAKFLISIDQARVHLTVSPTDLRSTRALSHPRSVSACNDDVIFRGPRGHILLLDRRRH